MNKQLLRNILISSLIAITTGCTMFSHISKRSDHDLCYQGFYGEAPKSNIKIINSSVTKMVDDFYPSSQCENDKKWIKSHTCCATFELIVPDEWIKKRIANLELIPKESKLQDDYELIDQFPDWYAPNQSTEYQIFSSKILQSSTFPICELLIDKSTSDKENKHIFIHYDQYPL